MNLSLDRRDRLAGLAVFFVFVAGGVAYAVIPSSGGVIHACYKKSSGHLRVIDTDAGATCTTGESALSWSQTGPPGPTGLTGPSDVWHTGSTEPSPLAVLPEGSVEGAVLTTLASLVLPAGNFFVAAKTSLADLDEESIFYCTLTRDGSSQVVDYSFEEKTTGNPANLALQTVVTLSNAGSVAFNCGSTGPNSFTTSSKLTAIKIGTVH